MKIIITGGHHTSAIPVLKELKRRVPGIQIIWFGHRHSQKGNKSDTLEYREITSLGIPFHDLKAGKFYKTYNIGRLLKIPLGLFQALYLLIKEKPDVILSFGGYLAVPTVIGGWILGVPALTHEQTVTVGYANKLVSKFAEKVLISWEESAKYFDPEKTIFTGLPLRASIFNSVSNSFDTDNSLPYVYVTAGKTGSHVINETIADCLSELLQISNVIHQCGDHSEYLDYERLKEQYSNIEQHSNGKYFLRKYVLENEIGEAYSKASLVVSRAGAHTIMELLYLQKPSVLIPIPWASHNEQYKNAEVLKNYGLSEIIEQADLSKDTLMTAVNKILSNPGDYLISTETDITRKNNAAELITDEVLTLVRYKK